MLCKSLTHWFIYLALKHKVIAKLAYPGKANMYSGHIRPETKKLCILFLSFYPDAHFNVFLDLDYFGVINQRHMPTPTVYSQINRTRHNIFV